jgi:MFS family permease
MVFFSPTVGWMLYKWQKRRLILGVGLGCLGLAMIGYAFLPGFLFESNPALLVASLLVLRVLQGFGSCSVQTTSYAIACICFPEHTAKIVGLIEGAACAGIILSPLVGAVLFQIGGFSLSFYFFGLAMIASGVLCLKMLPTKVDGSTQRANSVEANEPIKTAEDDDSFKTAERKLNFCTLLSNAGTAFPIILAFVNYLSFVEVEPTIALYLTKQFQFAQA